jgi:hypothetical protein
MSQGRELSEYIGTERDPRLKKEKLKGYFSDASLVRTLNF